MRLLLCATILALALLTGCAAPAAPPPTSAPAAPPPTTAPAAPAPTTAPAAKAPAPTVPAVLAPAQMPTAAAVAGAPSPVAAAKPQLVGGKLPALADGFPNRPITLWTPQPPGHSDDIFNKTVAEVAERYSPVRIPTASRAAGPGLEYSLIDFVKTQAGADEGYHLWGASIHGPTLRLYTVEAIKNKKIEDVRPIIMMEQAPLLFAVAKDSRFQSLKDVADFAKTNDLKVVASTTGSGVHVNTVLWAKQAGIKFTFIPTESTAQSKTVLMGGGAHLAGLTYDPGLEQTVRIVAGTGDTRGSGGLRDVPSMKELGFNVPGRNDRVVATLPSVPESHTNWVFQLLKLVAETPDYASKRTGYDVVVRTGDEVNQFKQQILELYVPVLRELGMVVR